MMMTPDLMWLLDSACKAALLLLLAWLLAWRLRRAAAAARHLVWSAAMVAALGVPALSFWLPGLPGVNLSAVSGTGAGVAQVIEDTWQRLFSEEEGLPIGSAIHEESLLANESPFPALGESPFDMSATVEGDAPAISGVQSVATKVSPADLAPLPAEPETVPSVWQRLRAGVAGGWPVVRHFLPWIWLGGALFSLLPLALGWWSLLRLQRRSQRMTGVWPELLEELKVELGVQRPVVLLQSGERSMPMTWGALPWRPAYILLPKDCSEWSHDRRRAVLLHELAHIGRWDCLTQTLAHGACALYWFNPLVWYGAHRMLIERERACDDQVLGCRTRASDYAEHLLSIARSREGLRLAGLAGIAMARRGWAGREGGLDGRVLAILDAHRQRAALGRLRSALLVTLIGAITLPVAMLQAGQRLPVASGDQAAEAVMATSDGVPALWVDPLGPWRSSHWAGNNNSLNHAMDDSGASARFFVVDAGRRHVWVGQNFTEPIDAREKYPMLVMRYRARGTHPDAHSYVLWINDGTGPDRGGLRPVRSSDLIADGEIHEIRRDMREVDGGRIAGDLTYIALGVHCGEEGWAEFELIELSFEADPEQPAALQPPVADEPITVRVRQADGRPMAGARVQVVQSPRSRMLPGQEAVTDERGTAQVVPQKRLANEDVRAGQMRVRVTVPSGEVLESEAITAGSERTIVWSEMRELSGVVVDETEQPVAGALVSVHPEDSFVRGQLWRTPKVTRTDAQGRWTLVMPASWREPWPEGIYKVLHPAWLPGGSRQVQSYQRDPIDFQAMRSGTARMVLIAPEVLAGTVVDAQGQPVAGAQVRIGPAEGDWPSYAQPDVRTDEQGHFRFAQAAAGPASVVVSARGHGPRIEQVAIPPQEALQITLPEATTVRFRVQDPQGQPVPEAYIALRQWEGRSTLRWSARTDAEGRAMWDSAPAGAKTWSVSASGFLYQEGIPWQDGQDEQVITIRPRPVIQGRVTDAESGAPIESFRLRVSEVRADRDPDWDRFQAEEGREGAYVHRVWEVGPPLQIRIDVPGYRSVISPAFDMAAGNHTFDVSLQRAEIHQGQVLGPDGEPAAGAKVYLVGGNQHVFVHDGERFSPTHPPYEERIADESGRITFDENHLSDLPKRGVALHATGYAEFRIDHFSTWGPVTLEPWSRVTGEVQHGNERLADERVVLFRPVLRPPTENLDYEYRGGVSWQAEAHTDDAGRFVFSRVPSGRVTVSQRLAEAHFSGEIERGMDLWLEPNQTRDIRLGGEGRSVVGQLVWEGERPMWQHAGGELSRKSPIQQRLEAEIGPLMPEGAQLWTSQAQQQWLQSEAGRQVEERIEALYQAHQETIEREDRYFVRVQVDSEGHLRAEDVPAGTYELWISLSRMEERSDLGQPTGHRQQIVGTAEMEVVVPEMPGGRSDQPLDIGEVKFVPWQAPEAIPTPAPSAAQAPPATAIPAVRLATGDQATTNAHARPPAADVTPIGSAAPVAPAPRRYSFRHADYSLREEPQRVPSRTLGAGRNVVPGEAILFNWPIRWWASHWSGPRNTQQAAVVMQKPEMLVRAGAVMASNEDRSPLEAADASWHAEAQGHPRFSVLEAGKRKVWVKYFDMPIDAQQYPLLVFTYRARNIHQPAPTGEARPYNGYVLYIDDGSGPDYGGLQAIRQGDLVDDGEIRTITLDLRTLNPIGELIGLAVGLQAPEGDAGSAELDLVDLRFETLPELQENLRFVRGGPNVPVRVLDEQGVPIAGAAVILNAERKNWGRLVHTDAGGWAMVDQARMHPGAHMLRIEAAGHLPIEVRELDLSQTFEQPLEVRLSVAAPYRGQILDEAGQPVPGAVVRVRAAANAGDLWTRQEGEAITDAEGRFETLALARHPSTPARLTVHHPRFDDGREPALTLELEDHGRAALAEGSLALVLGPRREPMTVPVIFRDESGQVVQPQATLVHQQEVVRVAQGQSGALSLHVPATRGRTEGSGIDVPRSMRNVQVLAEGYVPMLAPLDDPVLQTQGRLEVTLRRGRLVTLHLTDASGKSLTGVPLSLASMVSRSGTISNIPRAAHFSWTTDTEGRIQLPVEAGMAQLELAVQITPQMMQAAFVQVSADQEQVRVILPELAAPPPTEPVPSDDGRRPGYDPQRIFRRLSGLDEPIPLAALAGRGV